MLALLDAIESQAFDQVGQYVCEEYREEAVAQFDMSAIFGGSPETASIMDAITFSVVDPVTSIVSQDETSAVVQVTAQIEVSIDPEAAREWVKTLLESMGMEATDEIVDMYLPELMGGFSEPTSMDELVDVVLENGVWLVCDDFSDDDDDDADESPAPSESTEPDESPEA